MGAERTAISIAVCLVLQHGCSSQLLQEVCQPAHAGLYITLNYTGLKSPVLDAQIHALKKRLCQCSGQVSTHGQIRMTV